MTKPLRATYHQKDEHAKTAGLTGERAAPARGWLQAEVGELTVRRGLNSLPSTWCASSRRCGEAKDNLVFFSVSLSFSTVAAIPTSVRAAGRISVTVTLPLVGPASEPLLTVSV